MDNKVVKSGIVAVGVTIASMLVGFLTSKIFGRLLMSMSTIGSIIYLIINLALSAAIIFGVMTVYQMIFESQNDVKATALVTITTCIVRYVIGRVFSMLLPTLTVGILGTVISFGILFGCIFVFSSIFQK